MHMVIRVIVDAKNGEEALSKATGVLERLVEGDGNSFDYYTTFDREGLGVAGKDRWGDLPPAVKADSEEGKKLIEEGLTATKEEFLRNIKDVKTALANFTDEEIFEGELIEDTSKVAARLEAIPKAALYTLGGLRYSMRCMGMYDGPAVWLYSEYERRNKEFGGTQKNPRINPEGKMLGRSRGRAFLRRAHGSFSEDCH